MSKNTSYEEMKEDVDFYVFFPKKNVRSPKVFGEAGSDVDF